MSKIVRFSPLNDIRFAPKDYEVAQAYGYPAYGRALHQYSLPAHKPNSIYYRKLQMNDPVCIQINRTYEGSTGNFSVLNIHDEFGNYLTNVDTTFFTQPNYIDEDTGEALYTNQFNFACSQLAEVAGYSVIRMILQVHYEDDTTLEYISEPIMLADKHEGTVLIEASHSENNYDTIFEGISPRPVFRQRVESFGLKHLPSGEYTSFENQNKELDVLYALPYNGFKLDIGGSEGVPEYMADSINRIMDLEKIRVDGRLMTRESDKMEETGKDDAPLHFYSVSLREAKHTDSYTFKQKRIKLYTRPGTYPYAISYLALSDGITLLSKSAEEFFNSDAEDDYVDGLNNDDAAGLGMLGSFSWDGDDLIYTNAEGEDFIPYIETIVYPVNFSFDATVNAANSALAYQYNGPHVVSWGETSIEHKLSFGATLPTASKVYPTTGSKTFRIYHNDKMKRFRCFSNGLDIIFTDWDGDFSANMEEVTLSKHNFNALLTLSLAPLYRSRFTIRNLTITQCQVKGITAGAFSTFYTPLAPLVMPWVLMKTIDLSRNKFTAANVDAFINEFHTYSRYTATGSMALNLNSPFAPPTGASSTARTAIAAKAWVLQTD